MTEESGAEPGIVGILDCRGGVGWSSPAADGPSPRHLRGLHELGVGDALQAVGEELEGAALGQQHQEAIESLDQVGVVLHIQQLQAEIWERRGRGWGGG